MVYTRVVLVSSFLDTIQASLMRTPSFFYIHMVHVTKDIFLFSIHLGYISYKNDKGSCILSYIISYKNLYHSIP